MAKLMVSFVRLFLFSSNALHSGTRQTLCSTRQRKRIAAAAVWSRFPLSCPALPSSARHTSLATMAAGMEDGQPDTIFGKILRKGAFQREPRRIFKSTILFVCVSHISVSLLFKSRLLFFLNHCKLSVLVALTLLSNALLSSLFSVSIVAPFLFTRCAVGYKQYVVRKPQEKRAQLRPVGETKHGRA